MPVTRPTAAPPLFYLDKGITLPPETVAQAAARHAKIAARRAGVSVICHRGAMRMAHQNTLSAYRAAMEMGADGLEIDPRGTKDGVLVLFHDDMTDQLIDAFGRISDFYYEELLLHVYHAPLGFTAPDERLPTLRAVLAMARQEGALLHLDIKVPGLDADILRLLEDADMLDHVVAVNKNNSALLLNDPRFLPLSFKGDLIWDYRDFDVETVRATLQRAGQIVIVDDPRLTLLESGRPVRIPRRLPPVKRAPVTDLPLAELLAGLFEQPDATMPPRLAAARLVNYYCEVAPAIVLEQMLAGRMASLSTSVKANGAWLLGMAARYRPQTVTDGVRRALLHLLDDASTEVRTEAAWAVGRAHVKEAVPALVKILGSEPECVRRFGSTPAEEEKDAADIKLRGAAAWTLGQIGDARPAVGRALMGCVERRGLHYDFVYQSLDGAMAARALGQLRITSAVPTLVHAIRRDDPLLAPMQQKYVELGYQPHPGKMWDFRLVGDAIGALGEIGSEAAQHALAEFLALPEAEARQIWPALHQMAAEALCQIQEEDVDPIVVSLLDHPHLSARGAAILTCLNAPNPARTAALREKAAWALQWL